MCSVGNDIDIEDGSAAKFMPEKPATNFQDSKCLKCRLVLPAIVLQNKYPYCKECFLAATNHKFKAILGKNRVISVDDKVLIWHRTGHQSTALLHFLRTGLDLTTPKKIRFKPIILFIEDHYSLSLTERRNILKKVDDEVKNFKFPVYYISLHDYVANQSDVHSILHQEHANICISENDFSVIKRNFTGKATKTVENEILNITRHQILTNVGVHLNCSCTFIPDLGMDIASQFLTSISLGRGSHIVYDIGTVDTRDERVKLLRPLRNFTLKELAFYNYFHTLQPVTYILPEENPFSSVQTLMNKFVSDLQINYPDTVSTIIRTGDKLGTDKVAVQLNEKCLFCKVPIESEVGYLQSVEATKFSHWISTQGPDCDTPIAANIEQSLGCLTNKNGKKFCFSCSRLF